MWQSAGEATEQTNVRKLAGNLTTVQNHPKDSKTTQLYLSRRLVALFFGICKPADGELL